MRAYLVSLFFGCFALAAAQANTDIPPEDLNIYVDADFSVTWQTAQSIEQGISAALATRDFEVAGHGLQIVPLDHRGNARRSIENLRRFDADEAGIAVFGGMHSPPYIRHLDEINDRQIPLLLAWSAAGALTRHRTGPANSIFRLSVDDTTVGPFLAREMMADGCQNIGIVVIDNGWGHGNLRSLAGGLADSGRPHVYEATMATEIGSARARHIVAEMSAAQLDCIGMVSIAGNGVPLMTAVHEAALDIRVYSHWGILAGGFVEAVPHAAREAARLTVVQSCGLTPVRRNEAELQTALSAARAMGWDYGELSDISAPAGFVHGFDLGLILLAALEQASTAPDWGADIATRRALLRDALENLDDPVRGILRVYQTPFSEVRADNMEGHEALSGDDLCLAQFDVDGRLVARNTEGVLEEAALDN